MMALYPVPHSVEWFSALQNFNPQQAAMTKQIISLAGRDDVCGVCGDDPATDYKIEGDILPVKAVGTLRLCEDCHEIRAMQGERFVRL